MPYGFDNTCGIVKDSGLVPFVLLPFLHLFAMHLTLSTSFLISASVCLKIIDEQESFIRCVLDIPFGDRKWKDLVTLDTLHAYRGGLAPTPAARRLNAYSRRLKLSLPSVRFLLILTFIFLMFVLYPLHKWKQGGKGLW